MRITIITAIYDDYDDLKPALAQESADVNFVCVTDRPRNPNGWELVVEPRPSMHPNVAAKRPKMLPWCYTSAHWSIWVDASFMITSPDFAREAIELARPIAQFRHPWRDCVFDEARASGHLAKYAGQPIERQMDLYAAWGHPEHWGLWATGVIARAHTDEVRELGARWLQTCQEWSYQDQLSQAVHLRTLGMRPDEFPGSHTDSPWLQYHGSSRH